MPHYENVSIGDRLPSLAKAPGRAQLVLYCAGSGDFNPLHWDQSFPQAQAIGDNIVHGRMKWSSLGQLLSDWAGDDGWVRSVSCQYRGLDPQGSEWTVNGVVVDKRVVEGRSEVEVEVWTENASGQRTTPGRGVVVFDA